MKIHLCDRQNITNEEVYRDLKEYLEHNRVKK